MLECAVSRGGALQDWQMDSMVLIEGFWGAGEEGDSFSPQNPACFFFFLSTDPGEL